MPTLDLDRPLTRYMRRNAIGPMRTDWLANGHHLPFTSRAEARDDCTTHLICIATVLDAIGQPCPPAWEVLVGAADHSYLVEDWHPYDSPCPRASRPDPAWCVCDATSRDYVPMIEAPELLIYAGNVIARFYRFVDRACKRAGIED